MPRKQKGREVTGIVLLDKPKGLTSNKALQVVKNLFGARKAGHTGSLDPIATGMLPICLGEATKVSGFLLEADKAYRAVCQLGVTTSSGDADGEIVQTRPVQGVDAARLEQVLHTFVGEISQIPPMHSAIKQNGVPLYKLAHQGLEVERKPRQVKIHTLTLSRLNRGVFEIEVKCSKGTYIRTLAEDIGEALGCGAHIVELRRTQVGPLSGPLWTLEQIQDMPGFTQRDEILLSTDMALEDFPKVELSPDATYYLRKGQAVFLPRMGATGLVRLYSGNGEFVGMGTVLEDGRIGPKRLMNQVKMS